MSTTGDLNTQLRDAVERKDVNTARRLLEQGAGVNTRCGGVSRNNKKRTVLMTACQKGDTAMVDLLLEKGAAVNETNIAEYTALMDASSGGHEKIVDLLLKRRADVDKKNTDGWTAVHLAALYNYPSIINRLVGCGATVDISENEGRTPLWWAACRCHVNCVSLLLSVGANPHHTSKSDGSPLDVAKRGGHNEVVKLLEACSTSSRSCSQTGRQSLPLAPSQATPAAMGQGTSQSTRRKWFTRSQTPSSDVTAPLAHTSLSRATRQRASVSQSGRDEELRQFWQQTEQKQKKLDVAVGEKRAMEMQLEDLQQQNGILQQNLDDQRQQVESVRQQKAGLQRLLDEHQLEKEGVERENAALSNEVATLRQHVDQLQALLTHAETAITEMRESEEVLCIPSADITLTDQQLGHGSYGEVWIGYWRQCPVAVKMLHKELAKFQEQIDLLKREVSLAWTTHHPNVASVCGVTLELEGREKKAWIIMELLQGSMSAVIDASRQKGVKPLTLREKVDLSYDSLCGLNYLQTLPRPILHGDIRPTNILVTAVMRAKLGDLGAARFSDVSMSIGPLSPDYTAPERMGGRAPKKTKETDIYSMGVSLCQLFTGLHPSWSQKVRHIQLIHQRDMRFVAIAMMSDDSTKRPPVAESLAAIGRVRETEEYKDCPPRRMVKSKVDGVGSVTLTDCMW